MQLSFDLQPPVARNFDPATSHLAAESARDLQAAHASAIVSALRAHGPMGKSAIAAAARIEPVAVARRMSELAKAQAVKPTGKHVPSTSGRAEREWAAL